MLFFELGITNQNITTNVEFEKFGKYNVLSKGYIRINKMSLRVVPHVLSWDRVFTKLYKKTWGVKVKKNIHCHIQFFVLKKTFESISIDFQRYRGNRIKREQELGLAVEKMYADCEVVKEEEDVEKANKQC